MKRRNVIILITRQDKMSKVYESHRQILMEKMNNVTVLMTDNIKLNGMMNERVQEIADLNAQKDEDDESSQTGIVIQSFENDRASDIIFFCFVHDFPGPANGSTDTAIVPVPAAANEVILLPAEHLNLVTANAYSIIALLNDQSKSVCLYRNSSTPIKLEDLQWISKPIEESYRSHFLESFARYNDKIRGISNYYAAKTARYTIIQNRLLPIGAIPCKKRQCLAIDTPHQRLESQRIKESQSYQVILDDELSTADNDSMPTEVENLRKQNEVLESALRNAAELRDKMLIEAEASLKKIELLTKERQTFEMRIKDLLEELQRSNDAEASSLIEKERLAVEQRKLEKYRQDLLAWHERLNETAVNILMEKQTLAQDQQTFEKDKQDLSTQKEKWHASVIKLNQKEAMLERDYKAKFDRLQQKEELLEKKSTFLDEFEVRLLLQQQQFRQWQHGQVYEFQRQEREITRSQQNLDRLRERLSERQEEIDGNERRLSEREEELDENERRQSEREEELDENTRRLSERRSKMRGKPVIVCCCQRGCFAPYCRIRR